jgi:dTDP-4-amino-4,6-dideoxygalactose transaminase
MGRAAAFSFYPGKNLGACGEAGAITTNDPSLVEKMKMLRDHGQSRKYYHDIEGYNGRLDALQAGILHIKLGHLKSWNELRQSKAVEYRSLLSTCTAIGLPWEPAWSRGVYHLYVIRTSDRDGMMKHLKEAGIGSAIHYPVPLHLQRAYVSLNYRAGDFPVTESAAAEIVSLPMYPQLSLAQQEKVAAEVISFVAQMRETAQASFGELISAEPMA